MNPTTEPSAIEFWFDFGSPYAYFASQRVEALAKRHARGIVWQPFLLGPVLRVTGMQPLIAQPLRSAYARNDWDRIARQLGIPFHHHATPLNSLLPSRAFYWLSENDRDTATHFAHGIFTAHFGAGQDISAKSEVLAVADTVGIDRAALEEGMRDERIKQKLRTVTEEAIQRGIFGAPFFTADDEPFWGFDRLPMLDEWLSRGGW